MSESLVRVLTTTSAVGAALAGGVFFAFSTFIMRALDDLPPAQGIAAMQSINRFAPNPWFMAVLFGTALTSGFLAVNALLDMGQPGSGYRFAGSALHLLAVVLTLAYHVPRNNALEVLNPSAAGAARHWAGYVSHWTAWNHVRTLSVLVASAAFILSLTRTQ